MTAPAIVIRIALEGTPRLQVDALSDREHARLVDWLQTHPLWRRLIEQAIALETHERERAA